MGKADLAALRGLWLADCRVEDAADHAEECSQVLAALAVPCELQLTRTPKASFLSARQLS